MIVKVEQVHISKRSTNRDGVGNDGNRVAKPFARHRDNLRHWRAVWGVEWLRERNWGVLILGRVHPNPKLLGKRVLVPRFIKGESFRPIGDWSDLDQCP